MNSLTHCSFPPIARLGDFAGMALDTFKYALRPCIYLACHLRKIYYVLPGFMPYDARPCIKLCCLDLAMSCADTYRCNYALIIFSVSSKEKIDIYV